jgi:ketosteroid isomerase-like protein
MQTSLQFCFNHPRAGLIVALLILTGSNWAGVPNLPAQEVRKIRAINEAYVQSWLKDDRQGVLNTFTPDAVIIPSGNAPIVGFEAMKRFWWPDDGSRTTIKTYTNTIDEISGSGGLAYVRGTSYLVFSYEKSGEKAEYETKGVFLMILQKQADAQWRITRRIWTDLRRQ